MLHLTVEGYLAATPRLRHVELERGPVAVCEFRVLNTRRAYRNGRWVDGETTSVDVTCWGALAEHTASLHTGECVIVTGSIPSVRVDATGSAAATRASIALTAELVGLCLHRLPPTVQHRLNHY